MTSTMSGPGPSPMVFKHDVSTSVTHQHHVTVNMAEVLRVLGIPEDVYVCVSDGKGREYDLSASSVLAFSWSRTEREPAQ